MEQTIKNRTKKFLSMLKSTAQNEAFAQLIADNLKLELIAKPWKLLRILDFIQNDLARASSDFTRLKIIESGLIQAIGSLKDSQIVEQIIEHINDNPDQLKKGKFLEKLNNSILAIPLYSQLDIETHSQSTLSFLTLQDLLANNPRQFFHDLIQNYQPLLADLSYTESSSNPSANKDNIKQMFMDTVGGQFKTDKIKLSDLIDESFFDDIDMEDQSSTQNNSSAKAKESEKQTVSDLINNERQKHNAQIINIQGLTSKRQKTMGEQTKIKYLIMNPLLAIIVRFTSSLVSSDWKVRQFSACIIRHVIHLIKDKKELSYFIISENSKNEMQVQKSESVQIERVIQNLLPNLLVFIFKDQFNDFEELKVLTPAREEASQLLLAIQEYSPNSELVSKDIQFLISQLPLMLISVEYDTWISRYNFFLIVKGLLKSNKQTLFQMFNRVFIESLLNVEDEVMILVTELIQSMIEMYVEQKDSEKQIAVLLQNLQQNLKQSDEIESSAISVFSLIQKIMDIVPNLEKVEFKLDLNTICPFNFHKIVSVRYSYNQIIHKCLKQVELPLEDLASLMKLTVQSLVMERTPQLVALLLNNLGLFVQKFQSSELSKHYLTLIQDLFQPHLMQTWLFTYQITSFESFIFYESKNFESLDQDYYKIVYRPLTPDEISQFYFGKMKNLSQAVAIMMSHSMDACSEIKRIIEVNLLPQNVTDILFQNQSQQIWESQFIYGLTGSTNQIIQPIHDYHFIYLLVLKDLIDYSSQMKTDLDTLISIENLAQIQNLFLTGLSEETMGIYYFKDLSSLQQRMQILWTLLMKHNVDPLITQQVEPLYRLMEQCYSDQRLTNLPIIQQTVENLMGLFGSIQITEIYECFHELTQIFTFLFNFATNQLTRLKSLSAILHLQLVSYCQVPLSGQLNSVIKPLLTLVKGEKVQFIQEIASQWLVKEINILMKNNKNKPAQQIINVVLKGIEQSGSDEIQDRGNAQFIKQILKSQPNLLSAYNSYIWTTHFTQKITPENASLWANVTLFIMEIVKIKQKDLAQELYKEFSKVITQQLCFVLEYSNALINDKEVYCNQVSKLVKISFELFQNDQILLVGEIVKQMVDKKNKVAFVSLTQLLSVNQESLSGFLKFIPVFIIPVIQNIQYSRKIFNDDKQVTLILAQLLTLLPLNLSSIQDLAQQNQTLDQNSQINDISHLAQQGFDFLQVFVNNQMGQQGYELQIPVKAQLREYQKQGINWMAQLGRYNLNCALCDDMGLGKTIQSLCVVFNESFLKQQKLKAEGQNPGRILNLIVCPTTITHNWNYEVQKFFTGYTSVVYEGTTQQREQIIKNYKNYDIIIISYEKLRNEIVQFQKLQFFYLILDEAHIIKNAKAKITQAVKQVPCEKKIALSGTPLQNRVSELWSIFDFLLPGFLEEEQVFNKKYNQYLTTNIKRLSEKLEETQLFVEALKSLKKRIQPFILRRTKDQVLKELPPKIIQDVICEMTPFQEYAHQLIEKKFPIQQQIQQEGPQVQKMGKSILQNLILHRKVCNHPVFVTSHPEIHKDKNIQKHLGKKSEKELMMFENSGKLQGLYDKLVECEIIENKKIETSSKEESKKSKKDKDTTIIDTTPANSNLLCDMAQASIDLSISVSANKNHRVLIFCQMKTFQKLIVDQVLNRYHVPHTQICSEHSPKERLDIVNRFNADESIRVLILTTAVGGLGLNLTGADTVIFAEHDWNPMRDLQAIDRAHRIGQTRQVNVYRLIMKNSLEEKIMGLQRFKENLAKSLVQSKGIGQEEAQNLEVSDLLKSFQEHSAFADDNGDKKQSQKKQLTNKKNDQQFQLPEDKIISNLDQIWKSGCGEFNNDLEEFDM